MPAVILLHEAFDATLREPNGCKTTALALQIGNAVRPTVNSIKLRKLELQQRHTERRSTVLVVNRVGYRGKRQLSSERKLVRSRVRWNVH